MSTYVTKDKPLEFDNAPDWLVAYMRYCRTMLGYTPNSVMTGFISLREYFQWLRIYLATEKSPKNILQLRQTDLLDMTLEEAIRVNRNDIETYLYFCADTLKNSEATRSKKIVAVRSFYNYLIDQKDAVGLAIENNPASRIKTPKTPKRQPIYLPENERTSLLKSIEGKDEIRDYAILLLITTCGLRVSEVVNISIRDVNFGAGTIKIHGKGNKERFAYPTPQCTEALQEYLEDYRTPAMQETDNDTQDLSAPFFISRRTRKRLTTRTIERIMQKHVLAAGIGGMGYTPHKLRHTTATMLAKDGVDILTIQQLMGHESPTTTQIYTHLGGDDIERAVKGSSLMRLSVAEEGNQHG